MIGFRIWALADNRILLYLKRHTARAAKIAVSLGGALPLSILMIGCSRKTPVYSGPPDTVLRVVMKKWEIDPARIVVPQGARVELVVSTPDVEHGFNVPALGINEPVQPEHPAVIRFFADKPGVYPMRCSIACGRGHDQMTGAIVIEANPVTNAIAP